MQFGAGSYALSYYSYLTTITFFGLCLINPCSSIRCYQCGEYNDGVGSITPCINYTDEKHLLECADERAECVKYDMDASTVRGCKVDCIEREKKWGTRIYCCGEDACNFAPLSASSCDFILIFIICASLCLHFRNNRTVFTFWTPQTLH